jgi:hypothetical protein
MIGDLSRRRLLAAGLVLAAPAPAPLRAAEPRRLAFAVLRNGAPIGEHRMTFSGDTVATEVQMAVKLGPVTVYRYRHQATERWSGGRFASLDTSTDSNGRAQRVTARRAAAAVIVETSHGRAVLAPDAAPLTHWNPKVFEGPLFNPQDGKALKVTAVRKPGGRAAQLWSLRGDAEIDDWYDEQSVWTALRGRLKDGSTLEYRRL